jgi:hypothetical protein
MRLPNAAHEFRPWRIRDIAPDFTVEDVWALPVHGGAEDFPTLLEVMTSADLIDSASLPTRVLWSVRDRLGRWFGLGTISAPIDSGWDDAADQLPIPGTNETSLADRLPDDLRNTAADLDFGSTPFIPRYRTDVEFAAELSNRTVHAANRFRSAEVTPSPRPPRRLASELVGLAAAVACRARRLRRWPLRGNSGTGRAG